MKHKILIVPDKLKDNPLAYLRCSVRWNNLQWRINVGYKIQVSKWSYDTQRVKLNTTHNSYTASKINSAIDLLVSNIEKCFDFFDSEGLIPSLDEMKQQYAKVTNTRSIALDAPKTMSELVDVFVSNAGIERGWSKASYKKFGSIRKHIVAYDDVSLKYIRHEWLNGFVRYLMEDANLINTSVLKYVGCIRWLLNWASERKYITFDYKSWKPKLKTAQTKVIFLNWQELMQVYNYPLEWDYQKHVRDVFCFCCFSGLRYSDVANLKHSDITEDYISITSIKDHEQLNINLNKYTREILGRYKDYDEVFALPTISNQKYNNYIKEVMFECKIDAPVSITTYKGSERTDESFEKWQLITTHTARKTFVCNALSLGIAPDVVMKWTGHSDYRSMKPYIDVADNVKKNAMSLFDKQ